MADFLYEDLLPIGDDTTEYRLLTTEGVSTVEGPDGRTFLQVLATNRAALGLYESLGFRVAYAYHYRVPPA